MSMRDDDDILRVVALPLKLGDQWGSIEIREIFFGPCFVPGQAYEVEFTIRPTEGRSISTEAATERYGAYLRREITIDEAQRAPEEGK